MCEVPANEADFSLASGRMAMQEDGRLKLVVTTRLTVNVEPSELYSEVYCSPYQTRRAARVCMYE